MLERSPLADWAIGFSRPVICSTPLLLALAFLRTATTAAWAALVPCQPVTPALPAPASPVHLPAALWHPVQRPAAGCHHRRAHGQPGAVLEVGGGEGRKK